MELNINNRSQVCKDSITGVRRVYLTHYNKLSRSEYTYNGVRLTKLPTTYLYRFDFKTQAGFSQSLTIDEGSNYYTQTLSLIFNKKSEFDQLNFQKLTKKDFRAVVEMKNGDYFLMGFQNGISLDKLETSETQQYTISFKGIEEDLAPYVTNLINTDLIIFDGYNAVIQNGDNLEFQNNDNYIY